MSSLTSTINVNVNSNIKKEANNILNDLGLNMSTAINIFLTQVVKRKGIPFEVRNPEPSEELLEALREADDIRSGKTKTKGRVGRQQRKHAPRRALPTPAAPATPEQSPDTGAPPDAGKGQMPPKFCRNRLTSTAPIWYNTNNPAGCIPPEKEHGMP